MPPRKKKKASSSSGNPARGFATTSVASKKSQSEQATEASDQQHEEQNTLDDVNEDQKGKKADEGAEEGVRLPYSSSSSRLGETTTSTEQSLQDLTPEELEERLYTAELQSLADKFSAKTARDASRIAGRWSTDVRVLRSNPATQPLTLASLRLTSEDWLHTLIQTTREDIDRGVFWYSSLANLAAPRVANAGELLGKRPVLSEDDAIAKLWTIQRALAAIGFEDCENDETMKRLLRFLQRHAAIIEANAKSLADPSMVWGLEEALDWLVFNYPKDKLPVYDSITGKAKRSKKTDCKVTPDRAEEAKASTASQQNGNNKTSPRKSEDSKEGFTEEEEDVSDLESDLEPDELLAAYIETKSRLFRISPNHVHQTRASKKKSKSAPSRPNPNGSETSQNAPRTVSKLQQKMKQIESDMLFDRADADIQWETQRILLARDFSNQKRQEKANGRTNITLETSSSESNSTDSSGYGTSEDETEADDGAIGALFSSVPSDTPTESADGATVTIRDFGKSKGISPRRVLEETCRARDPAVKFVYKLVSRTAFSNQHCITVHWSKPQDLSLALHDIPSMESSAPTEHANQFTMVKVATPDAQQSEAFVSTFALFQLFSESSREEKCYLRLPSTWRSLWFEFAEKKRAGTEKEERQTIESLREAYRSCLAAGAGEDGDDVVLTHNFKNRAAANKVASKSTEGSEKPQTHQNEATDSTLKEDEERPLTEIWAAKSSTASYRKMLQIREGLPMYRFKDEALAAVENNQVTIICGETGCGKSTQMPSFILERELSMGRACKIYCTEPRRISAITLAQRVSQELGENSKRDLGTIRSLVGYAIRLESKVASTTRLVYATTGIVLRMLETSAGFDDVSHIVIDEVHERSIETDFLLIILRSLMAKRPSLKIVLMSATVDATKFAKYFGGAPVLNVPGRTFPVETRFLEDAVELTKHIVEEDPTNKGVEDDDHAELDIDDPGNVKSGSKAANLQQYSAKTRSTLSKMNEYRIDYDLVVKLVEQIATNPQYAKYSKAILVFLPGIAEIRRLHDMILGAGLAKRFIVHSLHSSIASEDQQNAFEIPPAGMSKIVLSTNIAETGVTIPDVTCVIDAGKHKEMRFDERRQISRLIESFISRANAKQRRGRAGRVQEGLCFHLFTKSRHDEAMAEQQTPEMLRLSLQDLVMRVKICKLGDIQTVLARALDPPLEKNIQRAIDALAEVGALNAGQELTFLGRQLSKLPLDPYLGKLVLFGAVFGCLDVSLTLAAVLTSKSPFVASVNGSKAAADAARSSFQKGQSDLLTEFNAYAAWRRVCTTGSTPEWQFCKKSSLSVTTLCNIEDLKAQLLSSVADAGFVTLSGPERAALSKIQNSTGSSRRQRTFVDAAPQHNQHADNLLVAESVIAWALYPKLLVRDGKGWRNVSNSSTIALHPTSILRQVISSSSSSSSNGQFQPSIRYLSFYSITKSAGAKHPLAQYLHPVSPLPLLLLAGADASFHPLARVVSLDGARLRFGLDAEDWAVFVALKYFRARMEEIVRRRWKSPFAPLTYTFTSTSASAKVADEGNGVNTTPSQQLSRWWSLWEQLLDATTTTTPR